MKRMLMPLLSLALAACASAPPADKQAASADNGTVCERDARTGSMLPSTRCTTAAERDAARRGVDTVSESVRNQRAAQTKGGS